MVGMLYLHFIDATPGKRTLDTAIHAPAGEFGSDLVQGVNRGFDDAMIVL